MAEPHIVEHKADWGGLTYLGWVFIVVTALYFTLDYWRFQASLPEVAQLHQIYGTMRVVNVKHKSTTSFKAVLQTSSGDLALNCRNYEFQDCFPGVEAISGREVLVEVFNRPGKAPLLSSVRLKGATELLVDESFFEKQAKRNSLVSKKVTVYGMAAGLVLLVLGLTRKSWSK